MSTNLLIGGRASNQRLLAACGREGEHCTLFEEEDKAIVWAVCLLLWCCVCLVVVQQRRDADRGQSSRARPVCMLYSFINYTDFKAALFYNAGLL